MLLRNKETLVGNNNTFLSNKNMFLSNKNGISSQHLNGFHTSAIILNNNNNSNVDYSDYSELIKSGYIGPTTSTSTTSTSTTSTDFKNALGEDVLNEPVQHSLNALGEPTFLSLGLGGYTPTGLLQSTLEFFHVTFDVPWWGAIMGLTVVFRIAILPLIIKGQKNAIIMQTIKPDIDELLAEMKVANEKKNHYRAVRSRDKLDKLYQTHSVSPSMNLLPVVFQIPAFATFFMALKTLAEFPVQSFKTGGLLWFTDLTIHDPHFILPVFCCSTMLLVIELGADTGAPPEMLCKVKYLLRFIAVTSMYSLSHFPTAIFCYWATSNIFSLVQVVLFQQKSVRKRLGLPPLPLKHTISQK